VIYRNLALRHRLTVRVVAVGCSDDWDWTRRSHSTVPPLSALDSDLNPEHQHGLGQVLVRGGLSRYRKV
jgi:hypothetical protein